MNYKFCDAGKVNSKRPKNKRDCVIRSIALVLNKPYDDIYNLMAKEGRKSSCGTDKFIWQTYLNQTKQFEKISFPAFIGKSRMNLEEFSKNYNQGKYVVQMAGHLTTVIDGIVLDTFQPRQYGCVYAVWKKIT